MKTLHILQHTAKDGPGLISEWADSRGWEIRLIRVYQNEKLPEAETRPNLLILGGYMNIYQHRDHPWLITEKQMLSKYIEVGSLMFGICLGGQLLADTLGAKITQNPVKEIGWFPVNFTSEAKSYFPDLPENLTVLHWHEDTFSLPKDAVRLATSKACSEQGFFWKNQVLGLQFHPEVNVGLSTKSEDLTEKSSASVQDRQTLVAGYHEHPAYAKKIFFGLLDSLFQKSG
jgi:GMP synthase-like glutamine amidotransferase